MVFLATFLLATIFVIRKKIGNQIISPLSENSDFIQKTVTLLPKVEQKKPRDPDALIKEIKQYIDRQQGNYSVYVYDLTANQGYGINETTIYTAASVNKIAILAALYFEAQREKIDLDRRITIQQRDIQDYGTGSIRYEGSGGIYSLKTLAQLMIEKSDNTAAFVLTGIVGEDRIQELANSWGLTQTDIKNNKTSNSDMAVLLAKIYRKQIANNALTTEMVGFMDDSEFENRLPFMLPNSLTVYHKIGNEVGNIHDVGIIAHPKNPYYIGVLTNDIVNDQAAEEAIAHISEMVYDFMNSH
jgi:beta-lactamase class A